MESSNTAPAQASGSASAGPTPASYTRLHTHDWVHDSEFQSGIGSIVSSYRAKGGDDLGLQKILRRAQVFYWRQMTREEATEQGYEEWRIANGLEPSARLSEIVPLSGLAGPTARSGAAASSSSSGGAAPSQAGAATATAPGAVGEQDDAEREPYPTSFDAIAELIATGQMDRIPGIRDIPLEISDEPPSEAKLAPRPKPWERAAPSAPGATSTATSTPSSGPGQGASVPQQAGGGLNTAAQTTSAGASTTSRPRVPSVSEPAGFETVAEMQL